MRSASGLTRIERVLQFKGEDRQLVRLAIRRGDCGELSLLITQEGEKIRKAHHQILCIAENFHLLETYLRRDTQAAVNYSRFVEY